MTCQSRLVLNLLGAAVAVALGAGCTEELGQRCNGQTIEQWRSGNLSGGHWQAKATCDPARGEVCLVFDVASRNYPNHAYCVTSRAPDPACKGRSGRFCAAGNTLSSCVQGFRIAPGQSSYFATCPAYAPHCYEPEPGVAFCVQDTRPAVVCSGAAPRPMEYCADDNAICREADFAQFCVDATTSVTCLGGVLIQQTACDLAGAGNGRCVETGAVEVNPCAYASP